MGRPSPSLIQLHCILHTTCHPSSVLNMRSNILRTVSILALGLTCAAPVAATYTKEQAPIMASTSKLSAAEINSRLLISDVIPRNSRIGIYSGFTRDVDSISNKLDDSNFNATVLAPVDEAIRRLPRKPWEDPVDYQEMGAEAYMGDDGQSRASKNLQRFVEAHIIPQSPWKVGDRVKTMAGREIWYEEEGGVKYVGVSTRS